MATFPGGGTAQRYQFIRAQATQHSVQRLCQHLKVSRSGYYDWRDRPLSKRALGDAALLEHVRRVYGASQGRYGSPKVYQTLRQEGFSIGEKRIARLMRLDGLKARVEKVYRRMKKVRAELKALPNYRLEVEAPTGPNQQWSGDVTYIRHGRSFVYLAVILDLWSRRIVGWALSYELNASLAIAALYKALRQRKPKPGLIMHTDRGVEYRAHAMQRWFEKYAITHSMSRPGRCTDNAEVESFFKSLKSELIHQSHFADIQQLEGKMKQYIGTFYNRRRLHSSLNYLSPVQFENVA
ncbi:IS3 family transposase [Lacimicrobium sp. SS2-24]|uniref:IS3 family transposase n=1 Tax=Lacimicrobium sp. SS2-24 TaxID=2005569 RepID=UPI000B4BEA6D|nr:IS3 family transposase [Lacimicrobium sp. SS2-24]